MARVGSGSEGGAAAGARYLSPSRSCVCVCARARTHARARVCVWWRVDGGKRPISPRARAHTARHTATASCALILVPGLALNPPFIFSPGAMPSSLVQ